MGEATHLTCYIVSSHKNIVHPSAKYGAKTTIGPHCMLGDTSNDFQVGVGHVIASGVEHWTKALAKREKA